MSPFLHLCFFASELPFGFRIAKILTSLWRDLCRPLDPPGSFGLSVTVSGGCVEQPCQSFLGAVLAFLMLKFLVYWFFSFHSLACPVLQKDLQRRVSLIALQ